MDFSVVACVSDQELLCRALGSCLERAQDEPVELIVIDNAGNRYSVPQALNLGAARAHGEILVFLHQDVLLPPGWFGRLSDQIRTVEALFGSWGVLGVFGVSLRGWMVGHVQDPHGYRKWGRLPCRVQSLDEVCLAIRRESGLRFDVPAHDATGLYRRSLVGDLRFENVRLAEGVDFVWRVGERFPILCLGECLYSHRVNHDSITHRDPARSVMAVNTIIPYAVRSVVSLKRQGRPWDGLKTAWQCLCLHPFDPGYYKPLAFAVAPLRAIREYRHLKARCRPVPPGRSRQRQAHGAVHH